MNEPKPRVAGIDYTTVVHAWLSVKHVGGPIIACAMLVACTNQVPGPVHGTTCGLAGCGPAARLDIETVDDPSSLIGATITVCLDDRCESGPMPTPLPSCDEVSGYGNQLVGDFDAEVMVFCPPQGVDVVVDVSQVDGLADGDVYTVSVQTSDGTALVQRTWTATYRVSYPNGSDCEPSCLNAQLTTE